MEYLILIIEFFFIKGWRTVFWYLLVPVITGLLVFYKADSHLYSTNTASFHSNVITVLGILVGFTISTFTLLLTVTTPNIEKAKAYLLNKKIFSKDISLFDSVLTGLAYTILIQSLLLIGNFIYPVFIAIESVRGKIFFAINISILIHTILILLRSILDFYFILTRK